MEIDSILYYNLAPGGCFYHASVNSDKDTPAIFCLQRWNIYLRTLFRLDFKLPQDQICFILTEHHQQRRPFYHYHRTQVPLICTFIFILPGRTRIKIISSPNHIFHVKKCGTLEFSCEYQVWVHRSNKDEDGWALAAGVLLFFYCWCSLRIWQTW